jgi:hypothetical protein
MPTDKHRYTITGDQDIESALRRRRQDFSPGTPDSKILAALVKKGDEAIEEEERMEIASEERRRAAASRLAARFRRPDGFDYEALRKASELWLRD